MMAALAVGFVVALVAPPGDFTSDVKAANATFAPIVEQNEELLRDGKIAESTRALLDAAPEAKRTAAESFMLGNLLFSQDFALSYALHKKAFELAPDEPAVQYEWAIERHRKGEFAEAEALYAKLAAGKFGDNPQVRALHADCLLHVNQIAEAVAEWNAADYRENETDVETAFSWVYGSPHPIVRRGELLAKARDGDVAAIEELILLDLDWTTDWWNSRPKKEYAELDMKLAAEKLAATPERLKALELLVKFTPADDVDHELEEMKRRLEKGKDGGDAGDEKSDGELAAAATALGIIGDQPTLPANSAVASNILRLLIDQHAATADSLLQSFEVELERRAKGGDSKALDGLAWFYENAKNPKLAPLEQFGWEKLGDKSCACAVLGRAWQTLKSDDARLATALAKFPTEPRITGVAAQLAQKEGKSFREALVRHVEALLVNMQSGHPAAAGFKMLEAELAKDAKAAPKKK